MTELSDKCDHRTFHDETVLYLLFPLIRKAKGVLQTLQLGSCLSGILDLSAFIGGDNLGVSFEQPHAMEANFIMQKPEIRFSHLNAAAVEHWFVVYHRCAGWTMFGRFLIPISPPPAAFILRRQQEERTKLPGAASLTQILIQVKLPHW